MLLSKRWLGCVGITGFHNIPVGASLLAIAADQSTSMLAGPASSRASSLPQGKLLYQVIRRTPTD
ncbi:hypothetical protein FHK92_20210 [Pseudomonas brassicacearum subsp. neoaurantiaca]|uniref:Uncharacterized protein n=1 Tax=Pseudomonas brassicacearum subsp. neoaurantiaca TaxID=494916 RepID=A0A7V8UEI5_9PSED|nr:hypothetical protein [Pseudomonas brassicacearum subsp. neoaurantiaca]